MKSTRTLGWVRGIGATMALCAAACSAKTGHLPPGMTIDPANPDGSVPPPGNQPPGNQPPTGTDASCTKMDILFVIDNSGSMEEEQSNLIANFPQFINILNGFTSSNGAPLDYRVGVTTTGVAIDIILPFPIPLPQEETEDGNLQQPSACGMTRRWLERDDPRVVETFSCVANVGIEGSGMEMPLRATRLALVDRMTDGSNAGFLRDDALLAIVILTDENDCSNEAESVNFNLSNPDLCDYSSPTMPPPSYYVEVLDAVKRERGRWSAAIIAGAGPGACRSAFGDADEATRLKEFANAAGDNVVFSSICDGDLSGAMMTALGKFDAACQDFPIF